MAAYIQLWVNDNMAAYIQLGLHKNMAAHSQLWLCESCVSEQLSGRLQHVDRVDLVGGGCMEGRERDYLYIEGDVVCVAHYDHVQLEGLAGYSSGPGG